VAAVDCCALADISSVAAVACSATPASSSVSPITRSTHAETASTVEASPWDASRVCSAVLEADSARLRTSGMGQNFFAAHHEARREEPDGYYFAQPLAVKRRGCGRHAFKLSSDSLAGID
jgi:hypothetical protein